ncbi:hypothetical protein PTKIN_Ptkin10aG0202800 [Pterospermum kingtungense]
MEALKIEGIDTESEVEDLGRCIDEISTTVNQLEQRVSNVEQFYLTSDDMQLTTTKCSAFKDKVKEKQLTSIEKQQQEASHREAASLKRMQDLMRQFATILRQITQHKWAHPFMHPVDVEGLGLHDYYEVIQKPMDFGSIKSKMEAKDGTGYKNVREIYADVRLVFKNAMKYNDERHDVHIMAKTLLEKFEEKWLQLLPKVAEEVSQCLGTSNFHWLMVGDLSEIYSFSSGGSRIILLQECYLSVHSLKVACRRKGSLRRKQRHR